jgi:hypothetical protein
MKRLVLLAVLALLLPSSFGTAQDPVPESEIQYQRSPSDLQVQPGVSPQMWLYLEEMKRQDDPARAVRRKAEIRAEQRMSRIATRKSLGVSAARPASSVTPFTSAKSPFSSGSYYSWAGAGGGFTVWSR